MLKTRLIFGIITLVIVAGGVFLLTQNDNNQQKNVNITLPSQHQYFWSETCPHCTNVAEFMDTWEGKDVFEMEKFEVNESEENIMLFMERGTRICKKPTNQLGVPLLVTPEGECYSGDIPIIEYLKKLGS